MECYVILAERWPQLTVHAEMQQASRTLKAKSWWSICGIRSLSIQSLAMYILWAFMSNISVHNPFRIGMQTILRAKLKVKFDFSLVVWLHSTYGLQSLTIHVFAVTATPLGVYADGYAGDKLWKWIIWYFSFNELDGIVQKFTGDEHHLWQELGETRKASNAFRHISCPTLSMTNLTMLLVFDEELTINHTD